MRPEAVMVNTTQKKTYAQVLRELRQKLKDLPTTGTKTISKTRSGDLRVEMEKSGKKRVLSA